jgi:hypothetical protein
VALLVRAAGVAALAALAGCYDPSLRDCTVTCHGAGECANGQVCGADGYCAAPGVAGTCGAVDARETADAPSIDASSDAPVDAVVIDAPPDATPAQLHVTISGKGMVTDSTGTRVCTTDCLFPAADGDKMTFTAQGMGSAHPFQDWTTANCMGMGPTCTVTITAPVTTLSAMFK